jgi:O-antigen/teichoic acid export membrane protein
MKPSKELSNLRQKAVKGVIWSAIQSWGQQFISFGVFFLLARLLGPETFGLLALSSVYLAFIQIFLDQGLSTAIIQLEKIYPEDLDTAFWTNLIISIFLTMLSIACAGLAADFFKQPQLIAIIRYLSISFIFSGLNGVQQAILQRNLAFKGLAIRSLVAVSVSGIVGVTMAFQNFGVWSLVGQQLSNSFVQVLVLWKVSDWRPGFKFSFTRAKKLFTFGINIFGFNLINFFNRRSDDLLIGYFLGSVALGYYSVAYRLLLIMTEVLINTTTKVALPIFSKLQKELERFRNAFYNATQLASLTTFPLFLGVAALAPELIKILFGEQWVKSIPVMQVLSLIGPLHVILYYNSTAMMAMGKSSWRLWIQLINTISNVISFALVVKWGILAVASAYVIRGYLLLPISFIAIHKLIQVNWSKYFSLYATPLVASMGMISSIFVIKYFLHTTLNLVIVTVVSSVIGTAIYISITALISPKTFKVILNYFLTMRGKYNLK